MQYHFQVNAIVINPDIEGPTSEVIIDAHSVGKCLHYDNIKS